LLPSSAQKVVSNFPLTVRTAGTHDPSTQTTSDPQAVRSGAFAAAAQVLWVAVALQAVAYVLHGSAVPAGEQACPVTQAAMQEPALQTCPAPQEAPSATLLEVSVQTSVSPWQAWTPT
jgi:hypothetical protein